MNIICKSRNSGKTTDLVKKSAELGLTIFCADEHICKYILEVAKSLSLKIPEPIYVGQNLRGKNIDEVLVDDADLVLRMFLQGMGIKRVNTMVINYEHQYDTLSIGIEEFYE